MIPVTILATRVLANASPALRQALGAPQERPALAILTTDCDDATYIALDAATKAAEVEVAYSHSFYAGAANASTPHAGEVIGILCARTPDAVRAGLEAAVDKLRQVGFQESYGVPWLSHTVSSAGRYLAKEAAVAVGSPLAYLVAPPMEAVYALDAALKAADVRLCRFYAPPTETNFAGALLTGTQTACEAACAAFSQAVEEAAAAPLE